MLRQRAAPQEGLTVVSGGHDHHHDVRHENRQRLTWVLGLACALMVFEALGGWLTGSLALVADAGHMLTDVAGLALAVVAMRFAERPATPERTYGYHRVEILAALTNAMVLVGVSLLILVEALERLRHPPAVSTGPMVAIASTALVLNVVSVWLLKKGSEESLNVKAAYLEVLSDVVASFGVIVAGGIMWATGWYYADPIVSAGIGLFILPRTWGLLKEAVGVLLEGTPADINLEAVRAAIADTPGVLAVHDLHVWTLTTKMNALSAHAVLRDGAPQREVLPAVRERLAHEFRITHVTLQLEEEGCAEEETHV
jgi:cobalt-zinc-cadmium efflux system protein